MLPDAGFCGSTLPFSESEISALVLLMFITPIPERELSPLNRFLIGEQYLCLSSDGKLPSRWELSRACGHAYQTFRAPGITKIRLAKLFLRPHRSRFLARIRVQAHPSFVIPNRSITDRFKNEKHKELFRACAFGATNFRSLWTRRLILGRKTGRRNEINGQG